MHRQRGRQEHVEVTAPHQAILSNKSLERLGHLSKDKVRSTSCYEGIRNWMKRMVLTREEYRTLQVSDKLWRAVNVDHKSTLDASGALLLMKVLDIDSRWAIANSVAHPWGHKKETIDKFAIRLRDATNANSMSGADITQAEFRDAFLGAVRIHAHQAAEEIIKDLVYEYDRMQKRMHVPARRRAELED